MVKLPDPLNIKIDREDLKKTIYNILEEYMKEIMPKEKNVNPFGISGSISNVKDRSWNECIDQLWRNHARGMIRMEKEIGDA